MRMVVYLRNRLRTHVASGGSGGVPYTFLHGLTTYLAHVTVFGRTAYLRLDDHYRDKLSPKALRCMFIGYCDDGPGYFILFSTLPRANSFAPSMSRSLNPNPRVLRRPSLLVLLMHLH
jgi:hypothetical protein